MNLCEFVAYLLSDLRVRLLLPGLQSRTGTSPAWFSEAVCTLAAAPHRLRYGGAAFSGVGLRRG